MLLPLTVTKQKNRCTSLILHGFGDFLCRVRLAAHVSNGLKSRIHLVVGRI